MQVAFLCKVLENNARASQHSIHIPAAVAVVTAVTAAILEGAMLQTAIAIADPSGMRSLLPIAKHKYILGTHCVPGPVQRAEEHGEQGGPIPAPAAHPLPGGQAGD